MIFKHSGPLPDLIYSLPTIRALGGGDLRVGTRGGLRGSGFDEGPVSPDTYQFIAPLLFRVPYLHHVESFELSSAPPIGEAIDLDEALTLAWEEHRFSAGDRARWYSWTTGVSPSPETPWIEADLVDPIDVPPELQRAILVHRTALFRNPGIDYSFLSDLDVFFVGRADQFAEFSVTVPNARYLPADHIRALLTYISKAKLFVGNHSFYFALAESMKVRRVLEVYPPAPNVLPSGVGAMEAITQNHFEKFCQGD